ncbi:unnamed protein product [Polarella glacialis]|uniref:PABC domain-containing protein n=1 Tax=Polarella glacialis TaxID=89957 RepID=A0A813J8P0_POLGL|nr:unnamed protein product [Polarella glacialis]
MAPVENNGEGEVLQFVSPQVTAATAKPPSAEKERTLLGELIFLKVWPLVREPSEGALEPVLLCAKVVGMLMQLPLDELSRLVGCRNLLQTKVGEAVRVLGVQKPLAPAKDVTLSEIDFPGGGPPADRRGELLSVALSGLLGDRQLSMQLSGILLVQLSLTEVWGCLLEEKRLRAAVKSALRHLEREQKEEKEAEQQLLDFQAMTSEQRRELFASRPASSPTGTEGAVSSSLAGRAQAAQLLRFAQRYTKNPQLVARQVASALASTGQQLNATLSAQFELCQLTQPQLAIIGFKLPNKQSMRQVNAAGRYGAQQAGGAQARGGRSEGRSPVVPGPVAVGSVGGLSASEKEKNGKNEGIQKRPRSRPAQRLQSQQATGSSVAHPKSTKPQDQALGTAVAKTWKSGQNTPFASPSGVSDMSAASLGKAIVVSQAPPISEVLVPLTSETQSTESIRTAPTNPTEGKPPAMTTDTKSPVTDSDLATVPGLLRVSPAMSEAMRQSQQTKQTQQTHQAQQAQQTQQAQQASRVGGLAPSVRQQISSPGGAWEDDPQSKSFLSALLKPKALPKDDKPKMPDFMADFRSRDQVFPALGGASARDQRGASRRSSSYEPPLKLDVPVIAQPVLGHPWRASRASSCEPAPSRHVVQFAAAPESEPALALASEMSHKILSQTPASQSQHRLGQSESDLVQLSTLPAEEPRRGLKKGRGHQWSPVMDAFEAARSKSMVPSSGPSSSSTSLGAKHVSQTGKAAQGQGSSSAPSAGANGELATPQEARLRLYAIAEAKLQAVASEDFELAQRLKQEEQALHRLCPQLSWANVAKVEGGVVDPRAGLGPSASILSGQLTKRSTSRKHGGNLVFFLSAPGELRLDTFKPTCSHVCRRDALARITTAALWRGRGIPWDDVHEIVFVFEDNYALRIQPRFVASCPVPSEYHLIMVLGRALETNGVPGVRIVAPDEGKVMGGHVDRIVGEYAQAGATAVALLHEAYPQSLDFFVQPGQERIAGDGQSQEKDRTLIIFLGAVKDMAPEETRAVQKACRSHRLACVEANLGTQAEFTSKIIDVLHGHHLHGRLMPAVWRCARMPPAGGTVSGAEIKTSAPPRASPPTGTFWVFVPVGNGPRDLVSDDRKKDGMYEVPRCCISQLWCSKNQHACHALSFVFAAGEVLSVAPSLVTCLKMQHRAAPTERNLVNALRVGMGDQKADPALTIDKGCVTLGSAADVLKSRGENAAVLEPNRTVLLDLQLGSEHATTPQLQPYANLNHSTDSSSAKSPASKRVSNVVILLRQAGGRDFPRGFREKLAATLLGVSAEGDLGLDGPKKRTKHKPQWLQLSMPQMSVHGAISLLGHYWDTRTLAPALAMHQQSQTASQVTPVPTVASVPVEGSRPLPAVVPDTNAVEPVADLLEPTQIPQEHVSEPSGSDGMVPILHTQKPSPGEASAAGGKKQDMKLKQREEMASHGLASSSSAKARRILTRDGTAGESVEALRRSSSRGAAPKTADSEQFIAPNEWEELAASEDED